MSVGVQNSRVVDNFSMLDEAEILKSVTSMSVQLVGLNQALE